MNISLVAGKVTSQVQGQAGRPKQGFRDIRKWEWEQAHLWHSSGQDSEPELKWRSQGCGQEGAWVGVQGEAAQGK